MSEGTIVSGGVMHIHNSSGAMHIHNSSTEEAKAAGSHVWKPAHTVWKFSFEEVQGTSPIVLFSYERFPCMDMEKVLAVCTPRLRHRVHMFKIAILELKSMKPDLYPGRKDYWTGIGLAYTWRHSCCTWSRFRGESQVYGGHMAA